jgi:BirA family biotin operon repressor/biotin-[acetyl-CoA-carboxylase] ligase
MKSVVPAFQPLTTHAIRTALSTNIFGRMVHLLDEVPSTNTVAAGLAQDGALHGTVIVAEAQSAGRGRLGRRWHSPPGKNLYCSIILRPHPLPGQLPFWLSWIPLLSAVAAARTVQVVAALHPSVKWPNDIFVGPRKVGGLLCESSGAGTPSIFVVVGIGLNVNIRAHDFPEELRDQATSMAIEANRPFDRARVLSTLLSELEIRYETLVSGHLTDLVDEYRMRCSTLGRRVRISLVGEDTLEGWAESIAVDGSLKIVRGGSSAGPHGEEIVDVRAGDVVHLR